MTDLEDTLRLMFAQVTDGLPDRTANAALTWRRGRVQHRTQILLATGASVLVLAGGAGAALAALGRHPGAATIVTSHSVTVSPPPVTASCPLTTSAGESAYGQVANVCLPDPAPGFPLRAEVDTTSILEGPDVVNGRNVGGVELDGKSHPARFFSVARSPRIVIRNNSSGEATGPSGPEVQIEVTTTGVFATVPGKDGTISGDRVIDTVIVHGQPGYVVQQNAGSTVVYFGYRNLIVAIKGINDVYHPADNTTSVGSDLPTAELLALGNSLHLPS